MDSRCPGIYPERTGFGRKATIHDAQASLAGRWVKSAAPNGKCAIKMLEPSLWIETYLKSGRIATPNPRASDTDETMFEVVHIFYMEAKTYL